MAPPSELVLLLKKLPVMVTAPLSFTRAAPMPELLSAKVLSATVSVALVGTPELPFHTAPPLAAFDTTLLLASAATAPGALYSAAPMPAMLLKRTTCVRLTKPLL